MVQVLGDPTQSQNGSDNLSETAQGRRSTPAVKQENKMSREEHAQRMRELNMKRGLMKAPRRGWSLTDYQADNASPHAFHNVGAQFDRQASIPENAVLNSSSTTTPPVKPAVMAGQMQLPQRPKLPPPRRSQSVTDKEPETLPANVPQASSRLTLVNLPSELHYALFDVLDPIDGVCLGLAHSRLYDIHKRKYGTVSLSSRYSGPNDMEWAWRGAGSLVRPTPQASNTNENRLRQLRVKGQVYCRKCGISRCELHRHLKSWMGEGYEYCEIKEVFGKPAGEDAKPYCFMSSPKNPHRCGRHGGRRGPD